MGRRTSQIEDKSFRDLLFDNMDFELDASVVLDWVMENFLPEDVFSNDELVEWAYDNNFVQSQEEKEE